MPCHDLAIGPSINVVFMNGVAAAGPFLGRVDGREARRTPFVHSIPLLFLHERDRLVERSPAGTDVVHGDVLVPDRHATEQHEFVRG